MPAHFVVGLKEFVNPSLKIGRIPFGRTMLLLQLVGALVFIGYTLAKKQINVPFSPEPYLVDVILPDAAGLDPAKEPIAGVAGASAGKVVEVREEDGQAIVTLRLDPELRGKIFADAGANLRPINVLQVLSVNIEPGNPDTGPLPEGVPIEAAQTDTFVGIDELTGVLNADTQAQVRVLIAEAATALKGRESEMRQILVELGELTDTATPVAAALDERRELLAKLVDHLDVVFSTLGERGDQLATTIDAGSRTLEVTAAREAELSAATRELAPTVLQARTAMVASRTLAEPFSRALDQLIPVAGNLEPSAVKIRELLPKVSAFLDQSDTLVDASRRPLTLLKQGTAGLEGRIRSELIPAIENFGVTIDAFDKYKGGLQQTADLWSSAFSASANNGPYTQVYVGNSEIDPLALGFPSSAGQSRGGEPSEVALKLAQAFEQTCRTTNPAACQFRFNLPGLPKNPVLPPERTGKGG